MRALKNIAALLMGAILAFTLVTAAYGAGTFKHVPPKIHATVSGQYQGATLAAYDWHWWSTYDNRWINPHGVRGPNDAGWNESDPIGKNDVVHLVVPSPDKPDKVFLKSYRNSKLTGEAKVLNPSSWVPVKEGGRVVGWKAPFKVERSGQHYITAFVEWEKTPGRHYSYGWERVQVHFTAR